MPIPTARTIIHEILRLIVNGDNHDTLNVKRHIINVFTISAAEQAEYLPSGREPVLSNRLRNANFRLRREGLATFSTDGRTITITELGRRVAEQPAKAATYTEVFTDPTSASRK